MDNQKLYEQFADQIVVTTPLKVTRYSYGRYFSDYEDVDVLNECGESKIKSYIVSKLYENFTNSFSRDELIGGVQCELFFCVRHDSGEYVFYDVSACTDNHLLRYVDDGLSFDDALMRVCEGFDKKKLNSPEYHVCSVE